MVSEGLAGEYYVSKAIEGFHNKLQLTHEYLQDNTISTLLSLVRPRIPVALQTVWHVLTFLSAKDTIASDFSAPQSTGMNSLATIASLLSAGIFLAGSVTGVVGVVAAEAGLAVSPPPSPVLSLHNKMLTFRRPVLHEQQLRQLRDRHWRATASHRQTAWMA